MAYLHNGINKIVEDTKKDLELDHIREVMNTYPESEWWPYLGSLISKLEKWFSAAEKEHVS